jgi:suppressor for copper-sensitivity B
VTAEWCITCQVNKKLVLTRGASRVLLSDPNVVAMRADWTNPDEGIARYLESFNRFGIPFNVIYGAAAPNGLALPELLKESVVVDTFSQASGRNLLADDS